MDSQLTYHEKTARECKMTQQITINPTRKSTKITNGERAKKVQKNSTIAIKINKKVYQTHIKR